MSITFMLHCACLLHALDIDLLQYQYYFCQLTAFVVVMFAQLQLFTCI